MSNAAIREISGSGAVPGQLSMGGVVFLKTAAKGDVK
jgi:hypothetical protein